MYKFNELFLFNNMSEDELKNILPKFHNVSYKAGDVIFSPSNYIKALGIIVSGRAVAMTGKTQKRSFYPGDVFGAASLYGDADEYVSEILAKTGCDVAFLYEKDFKEIIKSNPICAENYITFLSDKIRFLNMKIDHYTCGDCEERILKYLQDNSVEGKLKINNMAEAAKMVGLSRAHFYRDLDSLEEKGIIRKEGKIIFIKENDYEDK